MTETSEKIIRVGSRKSELALIQTKHVISRLQKLYPEKKFEIHTMSTIGDRVLNVSLPKIGEKSLFTRDLEDALHNGNVDFVVHSLKDLPTALPIGMAIGAVLEREDSRDALVLNEKYKETSLRDLPAGSIIGTSSLRRTAQLRRMYPHLEVCDIRGNLNTRLAKLDAANSKFAGIILAQAGLIRMGWHNRISQILEPADLLYAVGQGALAVECRANDEEILKMLEKLMCLQTTCKILAERSFLKTLGGGCSAPVAVCTDLLRTNQNNERNQKEIHLLQLTGAVWSLNGKDEIRENIDCSVDLNGPLLDETVVIDDSSEDDNEEKDVSPRKKLKIDNDKKKRSSPEVVSDDIMPSIVQDAGDATKLPDIQYLIDVHGEMFKRCPFYATHQRDKDNGNVSSKDECPLKIPIGQDFMGKCPYVDTEVKVEVAQHAGEGKCPFTGEISKSEGASKAAVTNIKSSCQEVRNVQATEPRKCPFSGQTTLTKSTAKLDNPNISHKDCPFIQETIKLIDYDENKSKHTNNNKEVPCLPDVSEQLFCGLFKHKCFDFTLYEKCEELGKKLAENLIQKGALDIMKCAQDEIREKS